MLSVGRTLQQCPIYSETKKGRWCGGGWRVRGWWYKVDEQDVNVLGGWRVRGWWYKVDEQDMKVWRRMEG